MKALLKRYQFFLLTLLALAVLFAANRAVGAKTVSVIGFSFKEMLPRGLVHTPLGIVLGLIATLALYTVTAYQARIWMIRQRARTTSLTR